MRTEQELEEALSKVGAFLEQEDFEDDETLQAIYETLKWAAGYGWENTVEMYLPS